MRWSGWLLRIALYLVVSVALAVLQARLLVSGLSSASYWVEWLEVVVGLYGMYLGCFLQSAALIGIWRLGERSVRILGLTR